MLFTGFYIMKPGCVPRGVCTTNFQFLSNYYVSLIKPTNYYTGMLSCKYLFWLLTRTDKVPLLPNKHLLVGASLLEIRSLHKTKLKVNSIAYQIICQVVPSSRKVLAVK